MIDLRKQRRVIHLFAAMILFHQSPCGAAADEYQRLKNDATVGPSENPVQLKTGQVVQVLSHSAAKTVIMVTRTDGSKGVYEVSSTALENLPPVPTPTSGAAPSTATNIPSATPQPPLATPTPNPGVPSQDTPAGASDADHKSPPPDNPGPPEDKVTLIHVSWPETTKLPSPYAKIYSAGAGSYSYKLYLPPGYYGHPDQKYPALFIMSPDGNADLGNFKDRAHDEGWIVVMFVEAKNGAWEPIFGDMLATHKDVTDKFRLQEGVEFATGFSGGARGTSILTQICPGFNGELLQGAGFAGDDTYHVEGIPRDRSYAVFMGMGTKDSNFVEIDRMKGALSGIPFKSETFPGGHNPSPVSIVNDGLDWLIQQSLSASDLSADLKAFGTRHFDYLENILSTAPEGPEKTGKTKALVDLGDKLNFEGGSPHAGQLDKLKETLR